MSMGQSETSGQRFSRWFTEYPSTHVEAGRSVEVVPVERILAMLPKVYDGTHLVDCPYVDLLQRIRHDLTSRGRSET
jgi:hypothetical protein